MQAESRIYVAGHRGLVGSAIVRQLQARGLADVLTRTHAELDLTDKVAVRTFFEQQKPAVVFLAAAKVGGILANDTYPAEFIQQNLEIQSNVIDSAWRAGAKKLVFLGSSCIYPRLAPQPIREESLLTGPLEPTNEWYAIAKIAGIKTCEAYRRQYGFDAISLMPTNLYGPGDNFDLKKSHVLPALIRKFHEAKLSGAESVTVWGTGTPRREFLHVDDMAAACLHVMTHTPSETLINVGCGEDITIAALAELVRDTVGYTGSIVYDTTKPDGTPQKLLDVSRMKALGWQPQISLQSGVASVYQWFLDHHDDARLDVS
ncbi:MAG: GDP-L-fucose synthase [Pseudomonadota bacterium]